MSEIKLFSINGRVEEIPSTTVVIEKELQTVIENNMEKFFGVRFLRSEYVITDGRMDSIGIDENNCPVIFEYKRSQNENVINQGLFYLDWLLDHKGDFRILVTEKLGKEVADNIDWSVPCVICIAHSFTKYDIHAINQMQRNIKLVCYHKFGKDLILFEHLNAPAIRQTGECASDGDASHNNPKSHTEKLEAAPENIKLLYQSVCDYIESLGDDISKNQLKLYLAYKKVQNIACIEVYNNHLNMFLKLDPDKIALEAGFSRNVKNIGHYGTGDLQLTIKSDTDVEKAKPLIELAYNEA